MYSYVMLEGSPDMNHLHNIIIAPSKHYYVVIYLIKQNFIVSPGHIAKEYIGKSRTLTNIVLDIPRARKKVKLFCTRYSNT